MSPSRWTRVAAWSLGILLFINIAIGIYWSRMPDALWVNHSINDERVVVGYSTTDTLIRVA